MTASTSFGTSAIISLIDVNMLRTCVGMFSVVEYFTQYN